MDWMPDRTTTISYEVERGRLRMFGVYIYIVMKMKMLCALSKGSFFV